MLFQCKFLEACALFPCLPSALVSEGRRHGVRALWFSQSVVGCLLHTSTNLIQGDSISSIGMEKYSMDKLKRYISVRSSIFNLLIR